MNLCELEEKFSTHEKCLEFIEKQRWPEGIRCLTCGSDKVYRVKSSSKKQNVRHLLQCSEPTCKQQFTVTSGTIMHDSHLPLKTWLMAITFLTQAKKGMSAAQVQRTLGLGSYKTAWHLCHRIREAMKSSNIPPLGGVCEIDETYIGGKVQGQGVFGGKRNKIAVMGIVKRGGEIRLKTTGKSTADKIDAYHFIKEHLSRSAQMVCTDESVIYPYSLKEFEFGIRHQVVNHSAKEYVRERFIHTNTIEGAFGLFKRGIVGSFHKVSVKHLHRYLSEFEWRYNARRNPAIFQAAVARITDGKPLPYRKLIA